MLQENVWSAINKAGSHAYAQGDFRHAHRRFRAAAKDATRRNHALQQAVSFHNLALIYKKQKRYRKTYKLLLQALELLEKDAGLNNRLACHLLDRLGELMVTEDPWRAIAFWERAHEIDKNIGGLYQRHIPRRLTRLAYLYCQQGEYKKAMHLYQESCDTTLICHDRDILRQRINWFGEEEQSEIDFNPALNFAPRMVSDESEDLEVEEIASPPILSGQVCTRPSVLDATAYGLDQLGELVCEKDQA